MLRALKLPLFDGFYLLVTVLTPFSGAAAMAQSSSEASALAEAQSLESRGMLAEAAKNYQTALERFSRSARIRLGEGRTLGKLGRCEESNDVLRPLPATFRPEIEQILGVCYFRTHQFNQAVVRLKAAAELQPGSQEVWLDLARAYLGAGRDREAVNTLQVWLARNPRDQDALYWLGNVYNSMSQSTLDQMIARDPGNYQVLEMEGDQLRQKEDYDGALLQGHGCTAAQEGQDHRREGDVRTGAHPNQLCENRNGQRRHRNRRSILGAGA